MITAAAVLATASSAAAATVVPPSGQAAGRGYAGWLATEWKVTLATPPGGSPCHVRKGVEVLTGSPFAPGPNECTIPAGRTVFVNGPSYACTNRDPGPKPADYKACAKEGFASIKDATISIDGDKLAHPERWNVASSVFRFKLAKPNILGSKKRRGRGAAYGQGFLLKGLAAGTHSIVATGRIGKDKVKIAYKLTVTG